MAALPAFAAPTLEQAKHESGLRFLEGKDLGPGFGGAVSAERASARPNLRFTLTRRSRLSLPPPPGSRRHGKAPRPGTRGLTALGAMAGAAATAAAVCVAGTLAPVGLLALGGAVVGAMTAAKTGKSGWALARETALGAVLGAVAVVAVGAAAGHGLGRLLEKLF
ncbi:MAG: hypothetical protein HY554_04210 [Elusimicrobia bacterium]|nr:hypothetical protein [Elusimicrobiota bacterium]